MADKNEYTGLGSTVSKSSEEAFDFACDPCSSENIHLEAAGFCLTCKEYLCHACYKCHAKQSATKSHNLLDKSSIPKTKVGSKTKVAVKVTDVLTETCPKHTDELLKYVCNVHKELTCGVCMILNHASCTDRSYVPDVSDDVITSGEYKRLRVDLDKLVAMATDQQMMTNAAGKENEGVQSKCLTKIKSLRKHIDNMLDKLQKKAERNVNSFHQENIDKITKTSSECQTIISELQDMISNLNTKEKDGKKNQLYVDIKLSGQRLSKLEVQIQNMKDWCMKRYEIPENEKLQELESTLSALLSVQQYGLVTTARYQRQINVNSNKDDVDCDITSIAVLTGGRVVVTDGWNYAVKLIDVKQDKVVSRVSVSAWPQGVTEIGPNKVAVILFDSIIVLFDVSDVLSQIKVIQVPGTNMQGICSFQDNMLVICINPGCLKVIDMSGKVLNTIDKDSNGAVLLSIPRYVAVNSDQSLIYVTDGKANTVTILTPQGQVLSVFSHDQLQSPAGVTVGPGGDIFVCSSNTHKILQLSPDGQHKRILLDQERGLTDNPVTIAFSKEISGIYIGNCSQFSTCTEIQLFKLD